MNVTLYGIRQCDTCRAARKWLDSKGIAHHFHDLRSAGLDPGSLSGWLDKIGPQALLNRRSTTWRSLDASQKQAAGTAQVQALLLAHPTLIKRPVLDVDGEISVGFKAVEWQQLPLFRKRRAG